MGKMIIGIHGLANKPRREVLTKGWKDALLEGLRVNCKRSDADLPFEMVYWADLRYDPLLSSPDDPPPRRGEPNREPYLEADAGALQRYQDRWYDRTRAFLGSRAGHVLDEMKETLGLGRAADALINSKLGDLGVYWDENDTTTDRDGKERRTSQVLQHELVVALRRHGDTELMLISHSMGSIIAYDVLRDLGRPDQGIRVPWLLTCGSPLGIPHVKLRTKDARWDNEVRTPSIVTQRWINFADRADPVAFDSHLRDDYGPNKHGVRVEDDLILNDYHANDKPNRHKSYGYLRAPELSEAVAEFLG